jgi:hypothetical protein
MRPKIRRVCFDSSSSFYNPLGPWLTTAADARERFAGKSLRFHCATAFVYPQKRYVDFTDHNALFKCLVEADEIVTFNGRISDLIVLESNITEDKARLLWQKPHHDLQGWQNCASLKDAATELLPKLAPYFDTVLEKRFAKLAARYDEFMSPRLADTYRDAKFTHHLFDLYLASGDTSHTFINDVAI